MVDFGTVLFTAGVNLVGKLLFQWISEGKPAVRVATVDRQIAMEATAEAQRLRVRVDDLEKATKQALQEIVARTPELSYARSGLHSNLRLDFNPRDPNSSKALLLSLKQRLDEISPEPAIMSDDPSLPPGASLASTGTSGDGSRPSGDRSRQMLNDLRARVDEIESDRQ